MRWTSGGWVHIPSWESMTLTERIQYYDEHNAGDRQSADRDRRMYGRCGCGHCAKTRKTWQDHPSALDRPGRDVTNMASVNLCDREGCTAMVRGAALGAVYVVLDSRNTGPEARVEKEICPACVADVLDLLNTPPVTDRKAAYSEPYKVPEKVAEDGLRTVNNEQLAAELFQRMMKQQQREIEGSVTNG